MPSLLDELLIKYRAEILSLDEEAVGQIDLAFLNYIDQLQKQFNSVVKEIEKLQEKGVPISSDILFRSTRLLVAVEQVGILLAEYNVKVSNIIDPKIAEAMGAGYRDAAELIKANLPSVLRNNANFNASFIRFDDEALVKLLERFKTRPIIKFLLASIEPEIVQGISSVFIDAIVQGKPPKQAAADLYQKFGISYNRARTAARTEIITAYRDGNIQRYKDSLTVVGWRWSATLDDRTCPICIFMDGQEFQLDQKFGTHPECRCSPLPITKTLRELGIDMDDLIVDTGLHGEEWFKSIPDSAREMLLSKWQYEAYKSGRISLEDLVGVRINPIYGETRFLKTRKELRNAGFSV
jgi:SPP1 gp7 family putative phage head morphogenesis protein